MRRVRPTGAAVLLAVCLALVATVRGGARAESEQNTFPLANHFFLAPSAFSPDGRFLALGGSTGPAVDHCPEHTCAGYFHLWDLQTGQRVFINNMKFARVLSLVFSRDGRWVITGHVDGTVRVWDLPARRIASQFSCCAGTWVRTMALSPDDRTLAIGGQDGEVILWKFADEIESPTGVRTSQAMGTGHQYGVSSLVFDGTGRYLLSSGDDQHVHRWNVETASGYEFSRAPSLLKAHRGMVKTVALLPGDRQAVSGAYWEGGTTKDYNSFAPPDHVLRLWDVDSGRPLRSFPLTYGIRCCIQVVAGTRTVVFLKATSWNETPVLQVFNVDSGAVEREYAPTMGESFHTVTMHPNTTTFLIGIGDGQFILWDRRSGKSIGHLLSVNEAWAVFTDDGRADVSDGFRQWPCRNNIQHACAGGREAVAVKGLLPKLIAQP